MGLLASLLVVAGCPADTEYFAVFKLRQVAAPEVAQAVNTFAVHHGLRVTAATESADANTVRVVGDAASVQRAGELLAGLDRQPPLVKCEMVIVRLPAGFTEAVGLGKPDGGRWVLTRREGDMLRAAVRRTVRHGTGSYLSQPTMLTVENQTGVFRVGQEGGDSIVARVTPRCVEDDSVAVRLDYQITDIGTSGELTVHTTSVAQTTATLSAGGMVAMRIVMQSSDDRPASEPLVLATARRHAAEDAR